MLKQPMLILSIHHLSVHHVIVSPIMLIAWSFEWVVIRQLGDVEWNDQCVCIFDVYFWSKIRWNNCTTQWMFSQQNGTSWPPAVHRFWWLAKGAQVPTLKIKNYLGFFISTTILFYLKVHECSNTCPTSMDIPYVFLLSYSF